MTTATALKLTMADVMAARLEMARRGIVPYEALGIPPKLIPAFKAGKRYTASWGGRGSAKSRTFGLMTAVKGDIFATQGKTGVILCAREFQNSLRDSSFAEVAAAINSDAYLKTRWIVGREFIRHVTGKVEYVFRGLHSNVESIKGLARILLAWADEAEQILEDSWAVLIPTVREEGSEIYVTWNPGTERSATHKRFRESPTSQMVVVEMNWRDNPYFPAVLEEERLADKEARPDDYAHIWEGEFKTVFKGSYFSRDLTKARVDGRITDVAPDPLMTLRAYWDIGGTSAKADACTIWIVQFIGQKINVLDYYEAIGQPLATHVQWLRSNGYGDALCVLPHDGVKHDTVYSVTYESALSEAGFNVEVVPNQGTGAATMRIEAARRLFGKIWFNDKPTEPGRKALAAYHENWDDDRGIGRGPVHDWASHGADSFGLMCVHYEEPTITKRKATRGRGGGGWMGG